MMGKIAATVFKLLIASFLVGLVLSYLKIDPVSLLNDQGITPEKVAEFIDTTLNWVMAHALLGAAIVVPVWLVVYALKPPRNNRRK